MGVDKFSKEPSSKRSQVCFHWQNVVPDADFLRPTHLSLGRIGKECYLMLLHIIIVAIIPGWCAEDPDAIDARMCLPSQHG